MRGCWRTGLLILVSMTLVGVAGAQCIPPGGGGAGGTGVDLITGSIDSTIMFGSSGGFSALGIGSTVCNIGTAQALWLVSQPSTAVHTSNLYRLRDGRFDLIGMSWLKYGFFALAQDGCGCGCLAPPNGSSLGVGCSNVTSAVLAGQQVSLGPHVDVLDATLAIHTGMATLNPAISDVTSRRLRVADTDLDPALNPGAVYFVEVQYLHPDDASASNAANNCSFRELNVLGPGLSAVFQGPTHQQQPAITVWPTLVPGVQLEEITTPGGGRLFLGVLVTDLGGSLWRYDYALFNQNADDVVSMSVPGAPTLQINAVSYRAGRYHSGEPQDNVDWPLTQSSGSLTWSVAPGSNSTLGWNNMASFSFIANAAPGPSAATVEVGTTTISIPTQAPGQAVGFFERGDCSMNQMTNIADVIFLLNYLFPPGPPTTLDCDDACDANDDGALNLPDAISILNALFGAAPTPLPGPLSCGPDPTMDALDCAIGC